MSADSTPGSGRSAPGRRVLGRAGSVLLRRRFVPGDEVGAVLDGMAAASAAAVEADREAERVERARAARLRGDA